MFSKKQTVSIFLAASTLAFALAAATAVNAGGGDGGEGRDFLLPNGPGAGGSGSQSTWIIVRDRDGKVRGTYQINQDGPATRDTGRTFHWKSNLPPFRFKNAAANGHFRWKSNAPDVFGNTIIRSSGAGDHD